MAGRKGWWRSLMVFLAVAGPGFITAAADNDAGGIATYALAGAHYGYEFLWMLLPITVILAMVQEMAARMGAVTGKGLADLVREKFGVKWTLFAMATLLVANAATTVAEFSGVAAAMDILGLPRAVGVLAVALVVWVAVARGSYGQVQRVFALLAALLLGYVVSGFLARPDWGLVARSALQPSFRLEGGFILLFIATIGTTITPWMQFFLQSSVVDKGVTAADYGFAQWDVILGAFFTDFVAFFIIVSTAATVHLRGIPVQSVGDVARGLEPLAGHLAGLVFAVGLFGASILAAGVLPLSTSYAVCEAFGWESGVGKRLREAPVFWGLYTGLIVLGALVAVLPHFPPLVVLLISQDVNGILLPVILIFMLKLVNDRQLMGRYVNNRLYNFFSWGTVGGLVLLDVLLLIASTRG